jgi:iron complex transport system ATP-binding protein
LSGGEQQRVHFARTLAQLDAGRTACGGKSQIVFLDEPVASLDLKHQLGLIEEAMRLARSGLAVIAIMHDLQLATQCADRLLVLREGRCVADGRPEDVLTAAIIRSVFEVALLEEPPSRLPWAMIGADGPQGFGEVGPDAAPANAAEE